MGGEHTKLVQMLTIATDFDNWVDDNKLSLPYLSLGTLDDIKAKLSDFNFTIIDRMLGEYKKIAQSL